MVIAMIAVRMVEVSVDEVVHVVPMRDGGMAAARSVDMVFRMPGALVGGCAGIRMGGGHLEDVLIHMVSVGMVEVAVVEIVDMALVLDGGVSAAGAVLVGVVGMGMAMAHGRLSQALNRPWSGRIAGSGGLAMGPGQV